MERTVQLKSVINSNGVDAVDGKGIELIDEKGTIYLKVKFLTSIRLDQ